MIIVDGTTSICDNKPGVHRSPLIETHPNIYLSYGPSLRHTPGWRTRRLRYRRCRVIGAIQSPPHCPSASTPSRSPLPASLADAEGVQRRTSSLNERIVPALRDLGYDIPDAVFYLLRGNLTASSTNAPRVGLIVRPFRERRARASPSGSREQNDLFCSVAAGSRAPRNQRVGTCMRVGAPDQSDTPAAGGCGYGISSTTNSRADQAISGETGQPGGRGRFRVRLSASALHPRAPGTPARAGQIDSAQTTHAAVTPGVQQKPVRNSVAPSPGPCGHGSSSTGGHRANIVQ